MKSDFKGFEKLVDECREMLRTEEADQAVMVMYGKHTIKGFLNHNIINGDFSDEDAFVNNLTELNATVIDRMVCMWRGAVPDCPSEHLRTNLHALGLVNGETKLLLFTGNGPIVKRFSEIYGY